VPRLYRHIPSFKFCLISILQLAEAQHHGEKLAHVLSERENAISVLEAECERLNTSLTDILDKLSHESAASGDAEARNSELSSRQQLILNERDSLRRVVEELRIELSKLRKDRSDLALKVEDLQSYSDRLQRDLSESRGSSDSVFGDLTNNRQENVRLQLRVDELTDEVKFSHVYTTG
jgi:chromosome segregation ATPase